MKHIKFEEHRVYYNSKGKGPAVVLLHGFCEDSRLWEDFKNDLIEEKYRVICVDLPGFGQSEVMEHISMAGMAEAVAAVVKGLKLEEIILIGHSMGGYVALAFAERYPELLSGLGLFHSQAREDSDEKKAARQKSVDFILRQGSALYVKQTIPSLFAPKFINSNTFLIEKLTFRASRYEPAGIVTALIGMKDRPDRSEVLRQIKCPVLFIIGKLDTLIPEESSLEQTHLPKVADIHILDKVGHMGMFEAVKQTQSIVRQFANFCQDYQYED
ncbi:MAG: alpha/beta hydrolase [Saprospiraceae bacterium]|nr:alpha/beta hydrolase [Lewinella sp.]